MPTKLCIHLHVLAALMLLHSAAAQQPNSSANKAEAAGDAQPTCPIPAADFSPADYQPLQAACDADLLSSSQQAFCTACICDMSSVLASAFGRAGLTVGGRNVSALAASGGAPSMAAASQLSQLMGNCSATLAGELLRTGVISSAAWTALVACTRSTNPTSRQCASLPTSAAVAALSNKSAASPQPRTSSSTATTTVPVAASWAGAAATPKVAAQALATASAAALVWLLA